MRSDGRILGIRTQTLGRRRGLAFDPGSGRKSDQYGRHAAWSLGGPHHRDQPPPPSPADGHDRADLGGGRTPPERNRPGRSRNPGPARKQESPAPKRKKLTTEKAVQVWETQLIFALSALWGPLGGISGLSDRGCR